MNFSLPSHTWFRLAMLVFALFLGLQATWIVLAETIRPRIDQIPLDPQASALATLQRETALRAASLAVIRGDLWAESAFTYTDLIWADTTGSSNRSELFEQESRRIAERALAYSPHRADVWLMLAALSARFNWAIPKAVSALKLSYYTGSNEIFLIPLRLLLSVRSQALDDVELREMVRRDIRIIIRRRPDLKPVVIVAYRNASSVNRNFLENTIAEIDPTFLASIRDGAH